LWLLLLLLGRREPVKDSCFIGTLVHVAYHIEVFVTIILWYEVNRTEKGRVMKSLLPPNWTRLSPNYTFTVAQSDQLHLTFVVIVHRVKPKGIIQLLLANTVVPL
jgi:hypothetical protein